MDLTASLEKHIGHEVAILIKEQIGEERLKELAQEAIRALTDSHGYYKQPTKIQEMTLGLVTESLRARIIELLKEDGQKAAIETTARELIEGGLEEAKKRSVDAIGGALAQALCLPNDLFNQVVNGIHCGLSTQR